MEVTATALQTVLTGQNVLFSDSVTCGSCSIGWRQGSGLIFLRGIGQQCRARFKATFSGNIAVPAGGVAGPISLSLAINGEPVASTTMTVTPTAEAAFFNVAGAIFIDVPKGCCLQISVENISTQTIDVQNANLIVERVA